MKKKLGKFLIMGATAFAVTAGALSFVTASMFQDQLYEKLISAPAESIAAQFNMENKVKNKYREYIASDKEFLSAIKVPQEYVAIDVILKENTLIDKAFYPLMKFGQFIFDIDENQKALAEQRYKGISSTYYSFRDENNQLTNDYIMLGVNALDNKSLDIYDSLYKIFGQDNQKMTSFIHFHEFGHKIAEAMNSESQKLNSLIEKLENDKGIKLSNENKHIITHQYSETFADAFSLLLMSQKYQNFDLDKTKILVAGLRLDTPEDDHLTAPGLIALHSIKNMRIDNIIKMAEKSALITTQFYSETSFSSEKPVEARFKPVHLIDLDHTTIQSKMKSSRDKFLEVKLKKNLDNY